MVYQFQRWMITLGGQIFWLCERMHDQPEQALEKAFMQYDAELQALYAYAEQHHLDLLAQYQSLTEIEGRLLLIHEHLQKRYPLAR